MTVHVPVRLRRHSALALAGSLVLTFGMRLPVAAAGDAAHPVTLAIGSPAPDFSLPGIDGRTYTLASFKGSKALVVIFTAVHCPTAEIYEGRIKRLVADYQGRGVAFVAIQPNSPKALRLDEMRPAGAGAIDFDLCNVALIHLRERQPFRLRILLFGGFCQLQIFPGQSGCREGAPQ